MLAFVALIWNEQKNDDTEEAQRIQRLIREEHGETVQCLETKGCIVNNLSISEPQEILLPVNGDGSNAGGMVFGNVFRNSFDLVPSSPLSAFEDTEADRLLSTHGRSLIRDFWGTYIAFLKRSDGVAVIADPTSSIPCFYMRCGSVTVVFSHLEKCRFLREVRLTINLEFVAAVFAYDKIQTGATGFKEINELLGGQRLLVSSNSLAVENLWDPRDFASDTYEPDICEAASRLRETVQYVVQSWAKTYDRIFVNLSGGLDSTIVLGCLSLVAKDKNVSAVHYISKAHDPTEVHYAREAVEMAGCELIELQSDPAQSLPTITAHPLTPRPYRQFLLSNVYGTDEIAGSADQSAFLTGQGGDHLFHVNQTPLYFADYIRNRGLTQDCMMHLVDASRLAGKSVWSILGTSLRPIVRRDHTSVILAAIERNRSLVNNPAYAHFDAGSCAPKWALQSQGLPPGKFEQVSRLVHLFLVRETLDRPVVRHFRHPLISQPLVELCLRLPIYLLSYRGVSRGLAREAFKGIIPESIRTRMTKGDTSHYVIDLISKNMSTINDAIAKGELAKSGLAASTAVEIFSSQEQVRTEKLGRRMLNYYAIEAWLRSWSSNGAFRE